MDPDSETRLAGFIARYTPDLARQLLVARQAMRRIVPRGFELVYDNYNALAIGYGHGPRASDALLSIAGYPRWVSLFFLQGATLPDPQGLLRGSGRRVRHVVLHSAQELELPALHSLVDAALAPCSSRFAVAAPLQTLIKSVSARQRPRRPAATLAGTG